MPHYHRSKNSVAPQICWLRVAIALLASLCVSAQSPALGQSDSESESVDAAKLAERDLNENASRKFLAAGKYDEATSAGEKMLAIEREIFPPGKEDILHSLIFLARIAEHAEDWKSAESYRLEALAWCKNFRGAAHWQSENARLALKDLTKLKTLSAEQRKELRRAANVNVDVMELYGQGRFAKAISAASEVADIRKRILGEQHPAYASSLHNLALLHMRLGEYVRAERLYIEAQNVLKRSVGEKHFDYATSLQNLALLYSSMGDYVRAESYFVQSHEILKQALGERHPSYATSLINLAGLYSGMGELSRAEPLYILACDIYKQVYGERHPSYATAVNSLAGLYRRMGNAERAEPLFLHACDIYRKALGEKHPDYATSLSDLARLYHGVKQYLRAEKLYIQCRDIFRQSLGENHPLYAVNSNSLAFLYMEMGEVAKAEPLFRQSLAITRRSLEATAVVQSERQQLAMRQSLRYQLDGYVSLGIDSDQNAQNVFSEVLMWKGSTLVRQRGMRLAADDPAVAESFVDLQRVAAQLATLSRAAPIDTTQRASWRTQISDLTHGMERAEAELSTKSAAFRLATKEITLDELLTALPRDAVLVDYLEFTRSTPSKSEGENAGGERQLAAFVIRHSERSEDRVRVLGLGPAAPVGAAIDAWRPTFGMDPAGAAAGKQLRMTVWEPLLAFVKDANTILVSTDGVLGRLPLGALPGREPGKYLLEDHRIAMLPVPQLLPALVNAERERALPHELLLLGDIDYDGAGTAAKRKQPRRPGAPSRAPSADKLFGPLPNTAGEIATIEKLFSNLFDVKPNDPCSLVKLQADEKRFRELGPQYRHLHLATHGFFAGAEHASALGSPSVGLDRSAIADRELSLAGHSPGLLSGLALAGANLEPTADKDDGILTAQEIGVMNLGGVETVVLSACDTGLGETAGGEGLLGVQRAFQVAGARTTVASFWKVDDLVTRFLMERFYRNLWEKDLSRLDALREAQIYILRHPEEIRGVDPLQSPVKSHLRTSPRYWAAFSLSGDWR